MKDLKLNTSTISNLFGTTDFGGAEKTDIGRRGLMVECVLKIASGYHCGGTITWICRKAELLSKRGNTTKLGMRWAFGQLYK